MYINNGKQLNYINIKLIIENPDPKANRWHAVTVAK